MSLLIKLIKPKGRLVLRELTKPDEITTTLKLTGFINIQSNDPNILICEKPNYEIGSSSKLSFAKKQNDKTKIEKVWKIDNDDDELIDADDLLDEEDLQKPDPVSLKVCGTTGKRKACKDCSCGLAEELASENPIQSNPTQKSSCGSVSIFLYMLLSFYFLICSYIRNLFI